MNSATAAKVGPKTQNELILSHLRRRKTISPVEAMISYGVMRLASRIHELRTAGHNIVTAMKRDEAGHAYARYILVR
jgi:hypothetical protein